MTTSSLLRAEPAFFHCPEYAQTLGPEVADLSALAGFVPDADQRMVLDAMFALDRRGRLVAFEVCVVCSRQNLKTGVFKMAALGKVFLMERPLYVWSAHEFSTTQEAFRDLKILIEGCPELDSRVARIYSGNGDESIVLKGGQRIKFKARTKAGGRGLTGDDVGLDEAFALMPEHMGALLPTLSARPNPQVVYGSSAGLVQSAVLRGIRDRGRAGSSARLVYIEWCAPRDGCAVPDCAHALGVAGCVLDDEAAWALANPALGDRITVEHVRSERQAMPPAEFARERLGWWDEPGVTDAVFGEGRWEACKVTTRPPRTGLTFGIARSIDQAWTSVGVAAPTDRDTWHVGSVDRRRGATWVVARAKGLQVEHPGSVFVVDGKGPASALVPVLVAAGVNVLVASTADLCDACALVYDRVQERRLEHRAYPEVDEAVADAQKRIVGDRWAWGRRNSDVSMLEAVTLALWGSSQSAEIVEPSAFFV